MTRIYYFSGTGNTLWSAKKTAEALGGDVELYNIGVELQKETIVIEADAAVLLFPAYAFGAPAAVRRFIRKAEFKTPYVAVLASFGTSPGGTLAQTARILKRKNVPKRWFGLIPAVENYIAIFGPPKTETVKKRVTLQREATTTAAQNILSRKTNRVNTFRPLSAFVSLLFSLGLKIFYKRYRVSAACSGCGICEKVCPVQAITLRPAADASAEADASGGLPASGKKRPVFSSKCEHCQGCLNWCPQRAIHFARLDSETPRYHHPEISFADIERGSAAR